MRVIDCAATDGAKTLSASVSTRLGERLEMFECSLNRWSPEHRGLSVATAAVVSGV